MKETTATALLIETIEQYMGYDYYQSLLYAEKLTKTCHDMYVEDLEKENKEYCKKPFTNSKMRDTIYSKVNNYLIKKEGNK